MDQNNTIESIKVPAGKRTCFTDVKQTREGAESLEKEIDVMVYKLYEQTYDEVKIIDTAFALTEKEYENVRTE